MTDHATLTIVHYDPKHTGLKDFAKKAVEASKEHAKGARFLTFVPVDGPKDVAYVWFQHASHSELHGDGHTAALSESVGDDKATAMVGEASGGVKNMGSILMGRTKSHGRVEGKVPNYVVAYGVKFDPDKAKEFKEAAEALVASNAKSSKPVSFGVHRPASGGNGERLVLIGIDDLKDLDHDGHLNASRGHDHLGKGHAESVGRSLSDSVTAVHRQVLRYVPELSTH
jgi:hypothetical protein